MAEKSGRVSSKRSLRTRYKDLDKKFKILIVFGIIFCVGGVPLIIWGSIFAYNEFVIGGEGVTPVFVPFSRVVVTDSASDENLEKLCPVTILVNDKAITEANEIFDLTYYKSLVTAKKPEDINNLKLDLSSYDYAILITNPNEATEGYWARDYRVYALSGNTEFTFRAKHESTDIFGNILDITSGTAWTGALGGNFSGFLWFPTSTATERHWKEGGNWAISDDAWADLSTATQEKIDNEKFWRVRPTLFDMNDDQADHKRTGDYLLITETTALEFDFNVTIGASTSVTGLNITVDCDTSCLVEYGAGANNDKIYIPFTETWDTVNGVFYFNFELSLGVNISCSNVKVGTITIPGRYFNDVTPTFTSLQTLV